MDRFQCRLEPDMQLITSHDDRCVFVCECWLYLPNTCRVRNVLRADVIEKCGTSAPNIYCKVTDFKVIKETVTHRSKHYGMRHLLTCLCIGLCILQLYLIVKLWSSWGNCDCNVRSLSTWYFFRCCCNLQVCDCTTHSQFRCTCYRFEYPQLYLTITLLWKVQWCRVSVTSIQNERVISAAFGAFGHLRICSFSSTEVVCCCCVVRTVLTFTLLLRRC